MQTQPTQAQALNYPSGLSRLPQPLLIEPVQVDAALARLLGTGTHTIPKTSKTGNSTAHGIHSVNGAAHKPQAEADWIHDDMSGVEVTEHLLPEGLDFAAFHALLRLAH